MKNSRTQLRYPGFARFVVALVAIAAAPTMQGQPPAASSAASPTVLRIWGQGSQPNADGALLQVLSRLEAAYTQINPSVSFSNELRGNDSSLGGLYVGAADLAFMTREPSYIELDGYQQVIQGQTPLKIAVLRGGPTAHGSTSPLVLVVNSANPLASVALTKLKSIFAASRSTGSPAATLWQDLGVKGSQGRRPIHLYGVDTESDEAVSFSTAALGDNPRWACNYKAVPDTPDAASQIVQQVQIDPDGLGLATLDAVGPNVKVLKIANSSAAVGPTQEALDSGDYVLARTVLALARKTSEGDAEPAVRGFLDFLFSPQGQAILRSDGTFIPLINSVRSPRERL
jgi:phosphate transport system substrate-binding protein